MATYKVKTQINYEFMVTNVDNEQEAEQVAEETTISQLNANNYTIETLSIEKLDVKYLPDAQCYSIKMVE